MKVQIFAMGRKLFWNFILKNCMIVTDVCICSCMSYYPWIPIFMWKKWAKYHILFNKFQFIDQIAIKNVRQLLYISLHVK